MCETEKDRDDVVIRIATCSNDLSLNNEQRLVQNALLYADRVSICSPNVSMGLAAREQPRSWEGIKKTFFELPNTHLNSFNATGYEVKKIIEQVDRLANSAPYQVRQAVKQRRTQVIRTMRDAVDNLPIDEDAADELKDLRDNDLLEVIADPNWTLGACLAAASQGSSQGSQADVTFYFEQLLDALQTTNHLPLFDENTNDLIRSAFDAGKIDVSTAELNEKREADLAIDLFDRLPRIKRVKPDELVDIRSELHVPLENFRAKVLGYATKIKSPSWGEDFQHEADILYRQEILPELNELRAQINQTSPVRSLFDSLTTQETVIGASAGAIGLAVTNDVSTILTSVSPETLIAAGIPATIISSLKAYQDWRDQSAAHERHQLFYYHQLHDHFGQ